MYIYLFTKVLLFWWSIFQQCLLDSNGAYTEDAGQELAGRFVADSDTENAGTCTCPLINTISVDLVALQIQFIALKLS